MIGSSFPLCYPQIAAYDLLYHRTFCLMWLLTKHIRLVGVGAFLSTFCDLKLAPAKWRHLVPPTSGYPAELPLCDVRGLRKPLGVFLA
jgi:hypothetical protein